MRPSRLGVAGLVSFDDLHVVLLLDMVGKLDEKVKDSFITPPFISKRYSVK